MSAVELARRLDVPTNRVTEILNGRRAITAILLFDSLISSARRQNFGSTCKASMNYGYRRRKRESRSTDCRP
jgi:hypothetical protein